MKALLVVLFFLLFANAGQASIEECSQLRTKPESDTPFPYVWRDLPQMNGVEWVFTISQNKLVLYQISADLVLGVLFNTDDIVVGFSTLQFQGLLLIGKLYTEGGVQNITLGRVEYEDGKVRDLLEIEDGCYDVKEIKHQELQNWARR